MVGDRYAQAAHGWATAASLVYGPLARDLVGRAPHDLTGRRVLDAGAGTGCVTEALLAVGAHPVALDFSAPMLGWDAARRPPAVAADVTRIPFRDGVFDDAVAGFVLNHLPDPVSGFAELARVTKAGGAVLANTFGSESRSAVRDRVDAVAVGHGFEPPEWYVEMKTAVIPLLGTAASMSAAARRAGLEVVAVGESEMDVGVTAAADLVDYRFGQAQYAGWLATLSEDERRRLRDDAVDAVGPSMPPYRPLVVHLVGRVAAASR